MSCDFNKLYEGDFSQIKLCYTDLKLPAIRVQNPLNRTDSPELRKMALFDAVINNTDRKIGHLLPISADRVLG